MSKPLFARVALIGIGLIGSSLARALRRDRLAGSIAACARPQETLDIVRRLNLADEVTLDPAVAVTGAELVVIAAPLSAYAELARCMASALAPGAIVTDVGSVKEAAIRELKPLLPAGVHLVPGHPVAGTEHSGPEAGFAELFRDRWCILTPLAKGDAQALERVTRSSATASPPGSGVRMHQRSANISAKPLSGPECSVPATGWAGTK